MVQAAHGGDVATGGGDARLGAPTRDEITAHGEIVVRRRPEAVAEVRRFVRLMVGRWGIDDYVPCLVASELVTNAIVHTTGTASATGTTGTASEVGAAGATGTAGGSGHDEVILRLGLADDGALWLEVQDAADPVCGVPRITDPDVGGESGRGLLVVDHLTRDWGVRPLAGGGKAIFAVIGPCSRRAGHT